MRHEQFEAGADADLTADAQYAAGVCEEARHHGQAEAGTGARLGRERIEDVGPEIGREAGTRVLNAQHPPGARADTARVGLEGALHALLADRDRDRAFLTHGVAH